MSRETVAELYPLIGQKRLVRFEDVLVLCKILNVTTSFGRIDLVVSPVSGSGEQSVSRSRVREEK